MDIKEYLMPRVGDQMPEDPNVTREIERQREEQRRREEQWRKEEHERQKPDKEK
jgi:hypothetical protein